MPIVRTAIGLMSGTSLDGIDAAIIRTDGHEVELTNFFITVPYKKGFRKRIKEAFGNSSKDCVELEHDITIAHDAVVKLLLREANMKAEDIDVIGFHGQTLFHDPANRITRQIGDGNMLARMTGINVVNDFRTADIKAGGQGAPLVPLFHTALFKGHRKPLAVINIGGVANITYLPNENENDILAFDTGPGNALIDDWILKHRGLEYDEDGKFASTGKVNEPILYGMLAHPYFDKLPPKSLDRNAFSSQPLSSLSSEDGAATLTAFTVHSIFMARNHLPEEPVNWVLLGGGRHNKMIVRELNKMLSNKVLVAEDLGINGDAVEAQAFAYLAVRSLERLPLTLPSTTGIKYAATGGVFCPA